MGDGLKRAKDYTNDLLAPFLRDVKRGGIWEVTDRYLREAFGLPIKRAGRTEFHKEIEEFAARHSLIMEHDDKQEQYKFIRAKF